MRVRVAILLIIWVTNASKDDADCVVGFKSASLVWWLVVAFLSYRILAEAHSFFKADNSCLHPDPRPKTQDPRPKAQDPRPKAQDPKPKASV